MYINLVGYNSILEDKVICSNHERLIFDEIQFIMVIIGHDCSYYHRKAVGKRKFLKLQGHANCATASLYIMEKL